MEAGTAGLDSNVFKTVLGSAGILFDIGATVIMMIMKAMLNK